MFSVDTKAKGALFRPDVRKDNGPILTGTFEVNSKKISVAGFLKTSNSGVDYLNIRVGEKEGPVFYGKLFKNSDKKDQNSPDYTGYLEINAGEDVSRLRIAGWKSKSRDKNLSYISLEMAPPLRKLESAGAEGVLHI
jgi:hypothetical protein